MTRSAIRSSASHLAASFAALAFLYSPAAFAAEVAAGEAGADAAADAAAEAAPGDAAEDYGLTEIVVTATKRETNLQKTPISISVMGAGSLLLTKGEHETSNYPIAKK